MSSTARPVVRDDSARQRFELAVGEERVALAEYRRHGEVWVMTHTETEPSRRGQGWASMLVHFALAQIRADGGRVRPECPFVAAYLRRHPDEIDLVPESDRSRYGLVPSGAG